MDELQIKKLVDQFSHANELYTKGKFEAARIEAEHVIDTATKMYDTNAHNYYSFGHILEIYYFTYLKNAGKKLEDLNIEFAQVDISMYYRLLGNILIAQNKNEKSIEAFNNALKWNPVDLDSLFQLSELYKVLKRIDSVKKVNIEAYNFCCTRASLAHFYRNIGYYYLEKYKPEIAIALYQYSNIFYHTETADMELNYLDKALDKKTKLMEVDDIVKILKDNNIPYGPNKDTIEITYGVGDLEMKNENYTIAKDCYTMVYDITNDSGVEEKLRQLNAILK